MAPTRSEQYKLVLLNVRGIKSKLELNEIYNVVTEHDVIGLTETLSNAFDFENLKTHEVFSGSDKFNPKGFRGLALVVRKSLKYKFSETDLGLWVHVEIGGYNFSIGLYYAPCEGSKHWEVNFFDEIQADVLHHKCQDRNVIIMGDFNGRTGENNDYIEIEDELNDMIHRSICDKLVMSAMSAKTNGFLRNMKSNDPKGYWSLVKSFTKSDVNIPIDKTTVFQHFKNLSSASNSNIVESHYNVAEVIVNINKSFSVDEICCCLKKIKNGKSAGHDDIFPEFLKYAPEKLVVVITKFFNAILDRGEVPDDWALSVYCPIYKKGDRKDK